MNNLCPRKGNKCETCDFSSNFEDDVEAHVTTIHLNEIKILTLKSLLEPGDEREIGKPFDSRELDFERTSMVFLSTTVSELYRQIFTE